MSSTVTEMTIFHVIKHSDALKDDGWGEGFPLWVVAEYDAWLKIKYGPGADKDEAADAACKAKIKSLLLEYDPDVHPTIGFHKLTFGATLNEYCRLVEVAGQKYKK